MQDANKSKLIKYLIILIVIFFLIDWGARLLTRTKPVAVPPPPVVVQQPKLAPMTEYVTQTGTVVAFNSVNLVARVEGYLQEIEFIDGSFVKKGKELFVIEPQPYLDKLKEAQSSVVVQKADYAYSKAEYERQQKMYKQNATSLNNVEKWNAKTIANSAEIDKANANAENAGITYSYTHVLAPFDGRVGRHLIDIGNLVGHGEATKLAIIEQIDPIYVYFNLNELDLIKLRAAAKARGMKPFQVGQIPVYVGLQNETNYPHHGKMDFVNTGLNASTGTMEFRALLSNKDFALLPGLFVQVRVPISKPKQELTVPDTAVQYDQVGPYLFTVDKNNIVVLKRVQLGAVEQGIRAIVKGLSAVDKVVVDGIQNAVPGNEVTPSVGKNL